MSTHTAPCGPAEKNRFADVLASSSEILRAQFEAAKSLRHRGLRGSARELALVKTFLDEHFPKQFGFATGEVVSAAGSVSGQQDVIVYHASRSPVLYRNQNIQVVPAESVLGVVEVKSQLDKKELLAAVTQIKSAKQLGKTAYYPQHLTVAIAPAQTASSPAPEKTLGYIFAYRSIRLSAIKQYLSEWKVEADVDGVFVLDAGCLVHANPNDGTVYSGAVEGSALCEDVPSMPLLRFYLLLWSHLIRAWTLPIRLSDYFGNFVPGGPTQAAADSDSRNGGKLKT